MAVHIAYWLVIGIVVGVYHLRLHLMQLQEYLNDINKLLCSVKEQGDSIKLLRSSYEALGRAHV